MDTNNKYAMATPGQLVIKNVTIAQGAAVSAAIPMEAFTLVGVKFPSAMTSNVITLQDSLDGGTTYEDTYNTDNNAISWTFTQGRSYKILPADTASYMMLKIKVDQNEAAARTLQLTLRSV